MTKKEIKKLVDAIDLILLTLLFVVSFIFIKFRNTFTLPPEEDAAILMRYSQNLANGHGIVWNIGEAPVDGGTDFLYMVSIAALNKLGLSLESSVLFLCAGSFFLLIIIIYFATKVLSREHKLSRVLAVISGFWIVVGPGMYYTEFYYGVNFFTLFVCLSWLFAILLVKKQTHLRSIGFAVSALATGLIRPEGVIIVCAMLFAVILLRGWKGKRKVLDPRGITESKMILVYFILIFGILGSIYFIWRWNYFGYPLPNPFYKKGGGTLHIFSLLASFSNVILFSFPFIPIYIAGILFLKDKKLIIFPLIPISVFTLMWILLSNEMNQMGRFQYPIVPVVLLSYPLILTGILNESKNGSKDEGKEKKSYLEMALSKARRISGPKWKLEKPPALLTIFILFILISVVILPYGIHSGKHFYYQRFSEGPYEVALILNDYSDKDYTLAVTEAGLLPLYSNWRTVDMWGLNDKRIAHEGIVSSEYLLERSPEVIMFHAYFSPLTPVRRSTDWDMMVVVAHDFALEQNYTLAAVFGETPYNTHYYFVAQDFPESQEIVERIRNTRYQWPETGKLCFNYASEETLYAI